MSSSMLPSNASDWNTTNPSRKKGGPGRAGGFVLMLGLLLVLGGVILVAVTRLPTGTLSRSGATTSPAASSGAAAASSGAAAASVPADAAVTGTPADAATQQAIQTVIQNLDDAQAQAIATKNPNLMAATATPEFYAEEVASNQDLVDNGVTDVQMLKAEFGQATVDNDTATVTVFETWTTGFQDGTTEQSRDRNIYTLVQDNGTWKVKTDVHPDTPAAAPAGQKPGTTP
jgi:hypothetical protein